MKASEAWSKLVQDDPERAHSIKKAFIESGNFTDALQTLRTITKETVNANHITYAKKNRTSFFAYFGSAGFHEDKVEKMWKNHEDENGKKLHRARNHLNQKCLKVPMDDTVQKSEKRKDKVQAVVAKKRLRKKEARAVFEEKPDAVSSGSESLADGGGSEDSSASGSGSSSEEEGERGGGGSIGDAHEAAEGGGKSSSDSDEAEDKQSVHPSRHPKASPEKPKTERMQDDSEKTESGSESEAESSSSSRRTGKKRKSCAASSSKHSGARERRHTGKTPPAQKISEKKRKKKLKRLLKEIMAAKSTYKKSAHLWIARTTVLKYIKLRLDEQVNGKPLLKFLQKGQDKHGTVERVRALDLPGIIDRMAKAKGAIEKWQEGIDKWTFPCAFNAHRAELMKHVSSFVDAVAEARCHTEALTGMITENKSCKAKAADVWRKGRDKYRKWFEEWQIPPAFSKVCADLLYSLYQKPESCGVTLVYDSPVEPEGEYKFDTFNSPFLVDSATKKSDAECTYLQLAIRTLHQANQAEAVDKMRGCTRKMSKDDLDSAAGTFDSKAPWKFEQPIGTPFFEVLPLKLHITTTWTLRVPLDLGSCPLRGHPNFLMSACGLWCVVVLPSRVVLEQADFVSWFDSLELGELQKFPSFLVAEGQALWIPVGMAPVFMCLNPTVAYGSEIPKEGLPKRKTKAGAEQKHCGAIVQLYVHDQRFVDHHLSDDAGINIAAMWVKAAAKIFDSYKANAALAAWIETCKKSAAPAAVASGDGA